MRQAIHYPLWAVGSLPVLALAASLGLSGPSWGTTLDGFEISTDQNAVKVTLHTDQRVPYRTETSGHEFSIILPNTQLSPEQIQNGLPVVMDNKNKFIGRATPMEGGQVKITLPNLPAEQYSISVVQKPHKKSVQPDASLAFNTLAVEDDNTFEALAQRLQAPSSVAGIPHGLSPRGRAAGQQAHHPSMSQPVAHPHAVKVVEGAPAPKPTPASIIGPALQQANLRMAQQSQSPKAKPTLSLPVRVVREPGPPPLRRSQKRGGFQQQLAKLPSWALIGLSLITGLIGILGIVVGLIFLRRFLQGVSQAHQEPFTPGVQTQGLVPALSTVGNPAPKRRPAIPIPNLTFQDTARINAADYLVRSSQNVSEAVQKTAQLRFATDPRRSLSTIRSLDPFTKTAGRSGFPQSLARSVAR